MTTAELDTIIVPWAQEAEQSVLGGLLLDNTAWDRVGDVLDPSDFFDRRNRAIFTAIASLVTANKPADTITVYEVLRDTGAGDDVADLAYLAALSQCVPSASAARRYAEIVREKAARRANIAAAEKAKEIAAGQGDAAENLQRIISSFDALAVQKGGQAPQDIASIAMRQLDHYTALAEGQAPIGSPTGFFDLDTALNGGLQPGRVYVIAARPSVGKTAFALAIGKNRAEAGDGVLLLSQEMPAEECMDRIYANTGGIDYGRLQRGELDGDEWGRLCDATDVIRKMPFWVDDQGGLTLRDIRAKAFAMRRNGIKVLIIDYLQLCAGMGGNKGNRNGEIEEITRGIKALAKQLRLSVLLLSQLNRDVEKRQNPKPNLGDLRDSGGIEQDADCVLFLWEVRQLGPTRVMGLGIAKNRQGQRGQEIPLEFVGAQQRWYSSTADITPQSRAPSKREFD